jgi:putative copper resistance protein D
MAALELLLLVTASGLGTGLTRLLPPTEAGYEASRYVYLIGYDLPIPVTALDLVTRWRPDLVFAPLALLSAWRYLKGVRTVRRNGSSWPAARTGSWLAGCAVLLVATCSGLATYAPAIFSVHMVQHMLLATFVPALLVLGHGATLAVDASGPAVRARLLSLLDSSGMRLVRGPLVAWTAVAATLFGLYPTGVFAAILQQHWAHLGMDTAFLGTGLAVFWPVLGLTPQRAGRGLPAVAKVVVVFALMALHAGFSVWLLTRPDPVAGAFYGSLKPALRPDLLADQRLGALLGWALAEIPVIVAVIALVRRWSGEDRAVAPHAPDRQPVAG